MQGPTGWWPDPSGAHPFRYFENGDPTTWVSDGLGPPRRVPPETLPPPPSAGPETTRTVGWYQNVADPARFKYWDGQQWIEATDHPSPDAAQPAEEPPPAKVRRRRRPHAVLTVAEALAIALALVAVIAFAFQASGPVHTAARTRPPGPAVPTTVPPPTTAPPTTNPPSVGDQVAQWWTTTGGPTSAALTSGLQVLQGGGSDVSRLPGDCTQFSDAVVSATSAAPPPDPAIAREWQLTLSTSQRVSAACAAQRYSRVETDVQPALYTIRDLAHQVGPYLDGQTP